MSLRSSLFAAVVAGARLASTAAMGLRATTCDSTTLDNSTYYYPITVEGTTIFDVANATGRGVCDIGRENLMADVTIPPNVGQKIWIPAQVCEPDNESCLLSGSGTRNCILGGPRLYYTFKGDTYTKIATRLNITVDAVMCGGDACQNNTTPVNGISPSNGLGGSYGADDLLPVGQFVKIPQCEPSQCVIQPYSFSWGVYKDLADKYGSTVGQIMALSPTYNYSSIALHGGKPPPISIPINCTLLDSEYEILSR